MGIKWLDKSHRSPVSCKEISREQVANRLQSRCKQGLSYHMSNMSRITRNLSLRFLTRSDTNWAVQPQKMARGLKFQTWEEQGLYFLDIAKKKLCYYSAPDLRVCFCLCKSRLSHDAAM